jgi:hypothetical protein
MAERCYAECHYAECHYAECHCAECHHRGVKGSTHLGSGIIRKYKTWKGQTREYSEGNCHCTIDLLFDWLGLVCFANKNKNCQLS